MKNGRLTLDEMEFIENNHKKMSSTDMARTLNRKISAVKNYIDTKIKSGKTLGTKNLKIEYDIKHRPYWAEIEQQFETSELPLFVYHWEKTISQFKDDVLPTEELQIVDMIKMEMLMNRGLKQQKINQNSISTIEKLLLDAQSQNMPDPILCQSLQTQLAMLRQGQTAWSKDFQELSNKKLMILKELKATRQQRIKNLEGARQTFIGMLSHILQDRDTRKEWGLFIEKMKIATDIEMSRLSEYHTYQDGVIDQPLFTPDTAKDDNVLR